MDCPIIIVRSRRPSQIIYSLRAVGWKVGLLKYKAGGNCHFLLHFHGPDITETWSPPTSYPGLGSLTLFPDLLALQFPLRPRGSFSHSPHLDHKYRLSMWGGKQPNSGRGTACLRALRLDSRRRPSILGGPHMREVTSDPAGTEPGSRLRFATAKQCRSAPLLLLPASGAQLPLHRRRMFGPQAAHSLSPG
ncbi:hypothetical protein NDU88_001031 [Pleurodeles waltl]|uniref:Uncharacterized protein n=1 Tax=Pleurodeles waltl TaxID=8319 RepID=A0AAV7LWF7_PLEWA|nr:hypothetical protein NDU88_001031 [Pleurodeles waltl]